MAVVFFVPIQLSSKRPNKKRTITQVAVTELTKAVVVVVVVIRSPFLI